MSLEHEQGETSGLSRRQLLTRGAIAGGLVWAAPVIRSTAAYATTSNGTERPCTNFFMVVIHRDAKEFKTACVAQNVAIGRKFPALPTHARVSIGTMLKMQKALPVFKAALEVEATPKR